MAIRDRRWPPHSMTCSARRRAAASWSRSAIIPTCFRPRSATAWCDGLKRPKQICEFMVRWKRRLTQTDRVILGGLVEGIWPPAPRIDPWLSRPMRHELGLDCRSGASASPRMILRNCSAADDVVLSHAAKVGGAPAVASRFLHRLEAVAGEQRWAGSPCAGEIYVRYADERIARRRSSRSLSQCRGRRAQPGR